MSNRSFFDKSHIDGTDGKYLQDGEVYLPRIGILKPMTKYNPRFPNTNQSKHCWFSYIDMQYCYSKIGREYAECESHTNTVNALCPTPWIEKWNEQLENGVFPGQELIFPEKFPIHASFAGIKPWPVEQAEH
eukprot:TRINITY_DN13599_c0_g1_i1.p1 TRINITY_DN13599_c0_g1~~TRINITY_DN13599_c0_g1_i1.p1  ORF type:complete len:132 (-),score=25.25 TRINITY_DN13599_c0_g1_i1:213-608(-)